MKLIVKQADKILPNIYGVSGFIAVKRKLTVDVSYTVKTISLKYILVFVYVSKVIFFTVLEIEVSLYQNFISIFLLFHACYIHYFIHLIEDTSDSC